MAEVGVGLIGCGSIAGHHARAWAEVEGARLVRCADVNGEVARKFAEEHGIRRWSANWQDVISDPEVSIVVICTPTNYHAEQALAALEAGKHVLCEKPIALTLEDASKMVDTARERGLKLGVGFQRRFHDEWRALREIIRGGRIGRPIVWRMAAATAGPTRPWFLDMDKGAGPFVDLAVHFYDLARALLGEPRAVVADLLKLKREFGDAPDTGVVSVEFEGGDRLIMTLSWGLPGLGHQACQGASMFDLLGPRGAILRSQKGWRITRPDGEEEVPFEPTPWPELFKRQAQKFLKAVVEGGEPEATGEDGLRALEVGLAAIESARTGRRIKLPLRPGGIDKQDARSKAPARNEVLPGEG